MSLSKYKSTPETTNTARLARLILGPCTGVLRDILKKEISPSDLSKEVKQWTDNLKNKKRSPLNPTQLDIIFPTPTNHYGGDYSDLDISFLYTILRNVSKLCPHSKGWGEDPDPSDRSVAANIERIRLLRNKYYGHSIDIFLSDPEFNQEWRNIWDIIVELEQHLGSSTVYQESVMEIKTCSMDPKLEYKYVARLGAIGELHSTVSKVSELLRKTERKLDMRTDPKLEKEIEMTAVMVTCHQQEMVNIFVKTRAYEKAKELLEKNRYVVIKGTPGAGKTTLAKWLLKVSMDRGKRPLQVLKMPKLYGRVSPFDNLAIFIDNVFGEFSFSRNDFNEFLKMKDLIESLVNPSATGNVLLIITIRNDIYMEIVTKQKSDSLFFSSVIDLSRGDYALDTEEFDMFFNNYNLQGNIKEDLKVRQAGSYLALGFPQCCRLARENPDFRNDVSSFLSSPFLFLKDYMKNLIEEKAVKTAVLIYILLKGGSVESSLFSDKKDRELKRIALKMLELNSISLCEFYESVKIFEGFLTIYDKISDSYSFSHSSIQDILFNVLIVAFPEEIIQNCHHTLLQRLTTREKLKSTHTLVDREVFVIVIGRIIQILSDDSPDGYESISLLELWNDKEFYEYVLEDQVCRSHFQECVDSKGNALLVYFAKSGHIGWTKYLLQNNCDENQKYRSLNAASKENHVDIVDFILKGDVRCDLITCFNAVQSGNLGLLLQLCTLIDVNQTGSSLVSNWTNSCHSVIQEICLLRQFHLVQPLLEQYPKLKDIKSADGDTVLHYASLCGGYDICNYLVNNYPQLINVKDNYGCTALHCACVSGDIKLISFLIGKGSRIEALTNTGESVLHIACQNGKYDACEYFVNNYPQLINIKDNDGYTALHDACFSGEMKLSTFLITKGLDINALSKSGLHIACNNGNTDVFQYCQTNDDKSVEKLTKESNFKFNEYLSKYYPKLFRPRKRKKRQDDRGSCDEKKRKCFIL